MGFEVGFCCFSDFKSQKFLKKEDEIKNHNWFFSSHQQKNPVSFTETIIIINIHLTAHITLI